MKYPALILLSIFIAALSAGCSSAPRISIEWTTASEIDTAGFNVYRSENSAGPFVKVNAETIPASRDALLGGTYQYEDTNVAYDKAYFYLLEDIEFKGAAERHGPIPATAPSPINASGNFFVGIGVSVASILGWLTKQFLSP
jgi:hypothetical protein